MMIGKLINKLLSPFGIVVSRRNKATELIIPQPYEILCNVNESMKGIQRSLLRSQITAKWSTVDYILRKSQANISERICPLCEYRGKSTEFGTCRSHCIFGGGDLLRHVCPICEVIFGPDKMFDLTASELSEDYEWHYRAYEEGDSTEREMRAFFALKPEKDEMYLNYGAGDWSNSVQSLCAQGWNVYAYEPHNSASHNRHNDRFICSPDQLRKMRFDGIFSNNVLEHFRHPVKELQGMAQLLRSGGRMAHATPCFEYLYEYTRFHLFFFAGRSKDILMELANLQLLEEIIDGDFICRVMRPMS